MFTHRRTLGFQPWACLTFLACSVGLGLYSQAADEVVGEVPKPPAAAPELAPAGDAPGQPKGDTEVLLRGQLHEAFASHVALDVEPGGIAPKQPPQPIDELPPDTRPEGDNVVWIPGYWAWDDGTKDFIWISGLWRNAPPDRRWVPGYWAEAPGGWRWHMGTWLPAAAEQIEYLPTPQASLERGPTTEAPSTEHIWIPGNWVYRDAAYHWRPGFWIAGHPGWVWIPDHYVWTPSGAIFVRGYWDYELDERGTAFCPVRFYGTPYMAAGYHYRPSVVIATDLLLVNLFVGPHHHHYYFGDYYHDDFVRIGYRPWYDVHSHHHGFDPMLSYYRWENARHGVDVVARLHGWHEYYQRKPDMRPPHVFPVGAHIVAPGPSGHAPGHAPVLGVSLNQLVARPEAKSRFVHVSPQEAKTMTGLTSSLRTVGTQRRELEHGRPGAGPNLAGLPGKGSGGAASGAKPPVSLKLPEHAQTFRQGGGNRNPAGGPALTGGGSQPKVPPSITNLQPKDPPAAGGAGKFNPQGGPGGGKGKAGGTTQPKITPPATNLQPKDPPAAGGAGKFNPQGGPSGGKGKAGGTTQPKITPSTGSLQPKDSPSGGGNRKFNPQGGGIGGGNPSGASKPLSVTPNQPRVTPTQPSIRPGQPPVGTRPSNPPAGGSSKSSGGGKRDDKRGR